MTSPGTPPARTRSRVLEFLVQAVPSLAVLGGLFVFLGASRAVDHDPTWPWFLFPGLAALLPLTVRYLHRWARALRAWRHPWCAWCGNINRHELAYQPRKLRAVPSKCKWVCADDSACAGRVRAVREDS